MIKCMRIKDTASDCVETLVIEIRWSSEIINIMHHVR